MSNDDIDGFIVAVAPNGPVNEFSNSTFQTLVNDLIPGAVYNISVYSYKDLLSVGGVGIHEVVIQIIHEG